MCFLFLRVGGCFYEENEDVLPRREKTCGEVKNKSPVGVVMDLKMAFALCYTTPMLREM